MERRKEKQEEQEAEEGRKERKEKGNERTEEEGRTEGVSPWLDDFYNTLFLAFVNQDTRFFPMFSDLHIARKAFLVLFKARISYHRPRLPSVCVRWVDRFR